jgi:signal peptidase II
MKNPDNKSMRLALAIMFLVFCVGCDQTTKYVATKTLYGTPPISCLSNTFRLEYALNSGGFLSLGENLAPEIRFWVFAGLNSAVLVVTVCVLIARWNMQLVNFVALILILGGGIGNLIDRVLHKGLVTDFINLGVGPVRTGIFNVADMALTAGALVLLIACCGERLSPTTPVASDGPTIVN